MKQKDELRGRVLELLEELFGVDAGKMMPTTLLDEDLGADSLDRAELAMLIEERLLGCEMEVPWEEAAGWMTPDDVVATARRLLVAELERQLLAAAVVDWAAQ
jgi:acyl carrier protein